MSNGGHGHSIRPIGLCEGPSSNYLYRISTGTSHPSVCYIWFIQGPESTIIVDAGVEANMFAKLGIPKNDLVSVEDGLDYLGLQTTDIDIVIVTHLHMDHIALGHLYKNARFIVQKKELDYAYSPHPIDAGFYNTSLFSSLRLEIIDGEKEVVPGVTVFHTPGHSPGGQSVEVNTRLGKAVITGFCCSLNNFVQTEHMKAMGWEVAVPELHQDCRVAYDSLLKVKNRADIILPLHEAAFISKESIP